ncbi:MAG: type II CRISPR RNA-guided endonuclease Cas9 [Neisseriaceae bacterium]|nr:type II CRISPR RNA-guided endonuclease Cas9 [Neisseriaceae bacterium]
MAQQQHNYIIGLDLGIASVGWACVAVDIFTDKDGKEQAQPIGLIDCGVRCFAAAENPKNGESLNFARRQARSQRRTIARRANRMRQVRKLLFKYGLLTANEFQAAYCQNPKHKKDKDTTLIKERNEKLLKKIGIPEQQLLSGSLKNDEKAFFSNVWQLRVEALHRKLERAEFAAVICHLVKHRGYRSTRKSERKNADAETGKMLKGVTENHNLLENKEYQSPAEIAVHYFFKEHGQMRNKQTLAYKRISKGENKGQFELDAQGQKIPIIKDGVHQKEGSYLHTFNRLDLENELQLIFERQKSFGNEYADKALCQKIKHILHYQKPALQGDALKKMWGKCSIYENELRAPKASYSGERFVWISKLNNLKINNKPLTEEQRLLLKELPFEQSKLAFTQVRKKLGLADNATFNLCRYVYDKDKTAEQNLADSEKATLFEAKFFHEVKKAYKNLPNEWGNLKDNHEKLDQIGEVLAFYKEDKDRKQHLSDFSNDEIEAILELNFDKSLNLSLKAIREILPLMENGLRYDEACTQVFGNHYGRSKNKQAFDKLPPIDKKDPDTPNNPVVYRTITQARKIINALIAQHGKPFRVHIEMGRDLGKSRDERNKIEKRQKENQAERERERERFIENHGFEPKGKDILLYRLYDNQHGKCLYSGKPIDLEQIFEKGYVEIDHAIPFSRSWDDSQNNKVLVLGAENQNKGNKTPFEWLGHDEQKWRDFEARVNACRFSLRKKQNILRQEYDEEKEKEFISRNINDTRYATRYLKNYLENNLAFSGSLKYRDENGEEHCYQKVFAPQGQITSILRRSWGFSKVREDNDRHHALDAIIVACATPFVQNKITNWYKNKENKNTNLMLEEDEQGEKHYSLKKPFPTPWYFFRNEINLRVFNQVEKSKDEWEVLDIEHRDELLDLIRDKLPDRPAELAQHEFVQPLFVSRKVRKKISGQGHLETLYSEKSTHKNKPQSGIHLRGGIVANATMIRIDVFRHKKTHKNYIVPIYAHQATNGVLPNRAIVSGKDKGTGKKKEWLEMTDEYEFIYSFYPFDLIEIRDKKNPEKRIFGYYRQCNIATGGVDIQQPEDDWTRIKHYQNKFGRQRKSSDNESDTTAKDEKQTTLFQGVGIQNMEVTKYAVDVLGRKITPIAPEERQGFDELFHDDE